MALPRYWRTGWLRRYNTLESQASAGELAAIICAARPSNVMGSLVTRMPVEGAAPAAAVSVLRQALAPAGLHVQQDGADLWFSVDESRWPSVRDNLSVQGDGRRFPGGQPVRPVLEPQPSAIDVADWKLGSTAEQRQTLRSVVQAQAMVDQAQQRLAEGRKKLVDSESAPALDWIQAKQTAAHVQAQLQGADFVQLAAVVPALRGLHSVRVRQLLSP